MMLILFISPITVLAQEIKGRITSEVDGTPLAGIDLNLYDEAGTKVDSLITSSDNTGFNISYLLNIPLEYTSYNLLSHLDNPNEKQNIMRYNTENGRFESTYSYYGRPAGKCFPISNEKSYSVYMSSDKIMSDLE